MDASAVEYYKIFLDVIIAAVISTVLLLVARRSHKQKTLTGYSTRPKSEKYAGYALLSAGVAVMVVSILELIVLSNTNFYSDVPFGLSGIQLSVGNQSTDLVSAQLLGLGFGSSFWLLMFGGGGGKLFSLGMDLLKGTQIKVIKKVRA